MQLNKVPVHSNKTTRPRAPPTTESKFRVILAFAKQHPFFRSPSDSGWHYIQPSRKVRYSLPVCNTNPIRWHLPLSNHAFYVPPCHPYFTNLESVTRIYIRGKGVPRNKLGRQRATKRTQVKFEILVNSTLFQQSTVKTFVQTPQENCQSLRYVEPHK